MNEFSRLQIGAAPRTSTSKIKLALLAGAVVVVVVVGLPMVKGLFAGAGTASADKTADATPPAGSFQATDGQWATLTTATVGQATFSPELDTDGRIAINDDTSTPVYSPFSGRVTKIIAKAGDKVAKGAPLLVVEAQEFVQAQNDLVTAAAGLATAKAQLSLDETAEKRAHDLYDAQGGALKDWQQAQVDLATAQGAFHSAEIALGAVRNRLRILGKSDSEIATLEGAPNRLSMAAEAVVTAPIAGTVTQRQVGPGEYINSGATGGNQVFSIGDLSTVWLVANMREADAPLVHLNDPVEVKVLAYPGRVFPGKVTFVAPSIDVNTRRLTVRAEVENDDGALKPEMFANFRVTTGAGRQSAAVPDSAVIYEGDDARVWVAHPADKTITLREIRAGRGHDGLIEVVDGLKPGETIVTKGALFIDRAAKGE